jgi:hypothetical protein
MGGAYRIYGSDGKCTHILEKLKGDPGAEGRIILKCNLGACDAVDWIHEAHDRVQLNAFVSMVMNLRAI